MGQLSHICTASWAHFMGLNAVSNYSWNHAIGPINCSCRLCKYLHSTVWPEPIWIKVNSWWHIILQQQSTYLKGPESASIEIPPFRPHFIKFSKTVSYEVNLTSQHSHLEVLLIRKFWSERGDFNWCRFWAF